MFSIPSYTRTHVLSTRIPPTDLIGLCKTRGNCENNEYCFWHDPPEEVRCTLKSVGYTYSYLSEIWKPAANESLIHKPIARLHWDCTLVPVSKEQEPPFGSAAS